MLGYAAVRLSGNPSAAPRRILIPDSVSTYSPDSRGTTDFEKDSNGDNTFTPAKGQPMVVPKGQSFAGMNELIKEAYVGQRAQAQKLRNNTHFNLQGITRRITAPDRQSQTEQGYTLPLQWFAYKSSMLWNTPAGRSVAGKVLAQPTLKKPAPTQSIPVRMPWNSAPGQY